MRTTSRQKKRNVRRTKFENFLNFLNLLNLVNLVNLINPILKFLDFWCITECQKPRKIAISKPPPPLDFVPHPGNSGEI